MAKFNPTPDQQAAIDERGGPVLVSAAAGSGKTRVLVDRLLSYILDGSDPANVTDFLIVTYTRAAAAELREKITDELSARLAEQPDNRHLRRQLELVHLAEITTVHGFCAMVLREYAYKLDLPPDFRVAEEQECDEIKQKVLLRLLESRYEQLDTHPGFCTLVDVLGAGRDDRRLMSVVLDAYEKLRCHPFPRKWKDEITAKLSQADGCTADKTIWGEQVVASVKTILSEKQKQYKFYLSQAQKHQKIFDAYGAAMQSELNMLDRILSSADLNWNSLQCALISVEWGRLKALKDSPDPALSSQIKSFRDGLKDAVKRVCDCIYADDATVHEDMTEGGVIVGELMELALDFMEAYRQEKLRRRMLDFGDLESFAISLLADPEGADGVGGEISARYREIMVDEYQDTNEIQDLIISSVSRGGKNRFMVGDVKQSIYRFRLADPTIFMEKYDSYPYREEAIEGQGRKIILSRNFRSRPQVLEAVNYVFSQLMSKEMGDLDYGKDEMLYLGASYPDNDDCAVELDVIDKSCFDGEQIDKDEIEPAYVAARIRSLLDGGMKVTSGGVLRDAVPSDIVILMRSPGSKKQAYAQALKKLGIPCQESGRESFWDSVEVSTALCALEVIDNPRQDVPLISVLRSPICGFSDDLLARIRLFYGDSFYDKLVSFSRAGHGEQSEEDGERVSSQELLVVDEFLESLHKLRTESRELPVDRLMWRLMYGRGLLGVLAEGDSGRSSLKELCAMAESFESGEHKGLFMFLQKLRSMRELGQQPQLAEPSGAGGVSIMSIHKSKGLEFPIVILCELSRAFNRKDLNQPVLMHSKLGAGTRCIDLRFMQRYPTLPRIAIGLKLEREMLSEELRVLYVAMTRPKEKLIMTCGFKDAGQTVKKLAEARAGGISPQCVADCGSLGEWVVLSALGRTESGPLLELAGYSTASMVQDIPWKVRVVTELPEKTEPYDAAQSAASRAPEADISQLLDMVYAHKASTTAGSKITATQIKGRFLDEESAENVKSKTASGDKRSFKKPCFDKDKPLGATERGVAVHLFMQHFDFSKGGSADDIRGEKQRMLDMELMSRKQLAAVDDKQILALFSSELGRKMTSAQRVVREYKFSLLVDAAQYYPGTDGDSVLLQGVIDCYLDYSDAITIIDFKTDSITPDQLEERAEEYRQQLETYAMALGRITGKPVTEKLLYFFALGSCAAL